jgi:serine/threonine protein kinase
MSAFQPGDLIGGRYRLMRIIGAGAMGTVWSARNESTDRDFALKLMLPDAAKNPIALQRFFQEAKASGRLRHRSIVEVYDLGRVEATPALPNDPRAGTPYLVMELLEGEPLDSVLRRRKRLSIGTALRMIRDVARALDVAHKQRIVHRDLKPANIYLHKTLDGTIVPKILDFGISKLTGPTHFDAVATSIGTVLGSPAYMSPEQAAGETDVDGRSDVWSLGVILYKALCGTVPFSAANYNALMMAIARNTHPPLGERVDNMPAEIEGLVDRCLSKERAGRFDSSKDFADELDKIIAAHPELPQEDLMEIVMTPIELPSDDAHTIATMHAERSQAGTLAATEVSEPLAPATPPAAKEASETRQIREQAPQFRSPKRVPIIAGAIGVVALLLTVIMMSRRHDEPAPSPAAAQPEPTHVEAKPEPTPPPIVIPPPPAQTPPASTPAPTVSAAPTPSPTTTSLALKPHAPAAPKTATAKTAKPPATAKPAHEGVTSSGI